jgi:DNA-binding transcriptional regulator GbsR (MarR family)
MADTAVRRASKTPASPHDLSPTARRFICDWSDLAERWGTTRATAEVLAYLCVSVDPSDAASIAGVLELPQEEVERALAELTQMGAVRRAAPGGHECVGDMAQLFRALVDARLRREVEPAIASVRDALLRSDDDAHCDERTRRRLEDMQGFLRDSLALYHQLSGMPASHVRRLLRMGGKIRRALGLDE